MKPECKPGDLALILKGKHDAGKIVRVIESWHGQQIDGRRFSFSDGAKRRELRWVVEATGSPLTIHRIIFKGSDILKNEIHQVQRSQCPDRILLPIRDDDVDADEALTDLILELSHD